MHNIRWLVAPASTGESASVTSERAGLHRYTLLACLLIVFVGLVTFLAPTDPDVWWHLRNGKLILDSGIPSHDVYSYTALGRTWIVQEWLTEVAMQALKSLFGYGALSIVFGLLQAAGGLVTYRLLRERGAGRILSLLLLMVCFTFSAYFWGVRPQVLTPLFLGGFYLVLQRHKEGRAGTRLLWLLPLLTVLWANLHASYFMGIVLVGVFIVGEAANTFIYRVGSYSKLLPLLAALAGCAVATLLNPYFVELWTYPLTYVLNGTSNPLLRYTQEWQPPSFHEVPGMLFALTLVLLAFVGMARSLPQGARSGWRLNLAGRIDFTDAIIIGGFTLLALQAVRLLPVYAVMVVPILAASLSNAWPALSRERDTAPLPFESRANLILGFTGASVMVAAVLSWPGAQTGPEPRTGTRYDYPVSAADYISRLPGQVRMYNQFSWGGYLIYRLYPQRLVFIDGRADMYREGIFEDAMAVQNVAPGWREVLTRYAANLAVISPGSPLDYALAHEPGWSKTYSDNVAVVYRKASP